MPGNIIQWFPGHMAQTRRVMKENLSSVDLIFEIVDARIPQSSRNPEIAALTENKKSIVILNKADLADRAVTEAWIRAFREEGLSAVAVDCKSGRGLDAVWKEARFLMQEKLLRNREKGMEKPLRAMVVGIPNVGKSTLINRFAGAKKAQAANRPGVTRSKQWVRASAELELLDMPGVLWPKFDDTRIGENLAMTGAIKDTILQAEEIAVLLCHRLQERYPSLLAVRYRLSEEDLALDRYDLFLTIGRKRGLLVSGGEVNEERCAAMLLEEFRSGTLGPISLEEV